LFRFVTGLNSGKLLKPDTWQEMTTKHAEDYGYGWSIGDFRGRKIVQHAGGINGFKSYLVYLPDDRIFVVVLSNADVTKGWLLSQSLAQILTGEDFKTLLRDSPIDATATLVETPSLGDQKPYVGTYALPMGNLTIALEGTKLMAEFANEPKPCELLRESEGSYFIRGPAGVQLIFESNLAGEVTQVKVTVRGREVIGKKSQ